MSDIPVSVTLEFTPNPNTLKFVVNRSLIERGAANFTHVSQTTFAPLAQKLFQIQGISAVLVGTNFVTVTKGPDGNWDTVAEEVPKTLETYLNSGQPIFDKEWSFEPKAATSTGPQAEIERKIQEVLDNEIRPAVAMDGGDILFGKFEEGVVYLHLQGACSACPSSIATLKMGVENRLKQLVPEVKEVVQI